MLAAFFFTVEAMGLLGTNHHVLASLTTTSFVVVTQWHHEDGISGPGPYWGLCSCGRYPEHLEAACVNCPIYPGRNYNGSQRSLPSG